jgi:hypothetical protein
MADGTGGGGGAIAHEHRQQMGVGWVSRRLALVGGHTRSEPGVAPILPRAAGIKENVYHTSPKRPVSGTTNRQRPDRAGNALHMRLGRRPLA